MKTNLCNKKINKKFIKKKKSLRYNFTFYKYFNICNVKKVKNFLFIKFKKLNILGRILISEEGINAQISIPKKNFLYFKNFFYYYNSLFKKINLNKCLNNKKSFCSLKIKIKNYILNHKIKNIKNFKKTGIYLNVFQVNNFINCKNTLFLDMRNYYEYEIGHFKNAFTLPSITFRNQLSKIIKKIKKKIKNNILMYCTGGIRCEISTKYILKNGFKNVFHIKGGIINYVNFANSKKLPINFIGKNFVFDKRLKEFVTKDIISNCYTCGKKSDNYINCKNNICNKLLIQCLKCYKKYKKFCCKECYIK
ncbi:rhodanese-related sulfurtransferase [Enterobacterales bacterium endosymbiont of Anomoneura mori]|uniref:oxygen-dependent tRNA uridine(34) hydroxylase TrhO n=1 Tax=Enterobacterales bacterium endosymbiont of Anomoneura mori TaxID=3132096 RepID=UPI00399D089F